MTHKLLVTLGPSSMKKDVVEEMSKLGIYLFRINLSHTKIEDLSNIIQNIKSWTDVPICLDSEGAQMRTGVVLNNRIQYTSGDNVKIHHRPIIGNQKNISFYPEKVSKEFQVGDIINVDFDSVRLKILSNDSESCNSIVELSGKVGSNRAADLDRDINFEAVTERDHAAIKICKELGVTNYAFSFANNADDVEYFRKLIGGNSSLISKIESIQGIMHLDSIIDCSDEILIDRGDLSRQVPIEKIPFVQRIIISRARSKETDVFVATNLLESMNHSIIPTRAEVNDVASTLIMGANGLVLAAETAIGNNPVPAVKMIKSMIKEYSKWTPKSSLDDILSN
tara:strand:+ start:2274 stop:3287 length:1014 start_codon:yes stop_codon:yes gene_type:complete